MITKRYSNGTSVDPCRKKFIKLKFREQRNNRLHVLQKEIGMNAIGQRITVAEIKEAAFCDPRILGMPLGFSAGAIANCRALPPPSPPSPHL
jgi:hypothetical protein